MTTYTNAEIASDLNLWNEYFNTSALMTDEEFHAMSYDQRLQMLIDAFGTDEDEEEEDTMNYTINQALDILCMYQGDLIPERYYTMSQTGAAANRGTGYVQADVYIALIEDLLDNGAEDRVTVTPIPTSDALAIWRDACDADGVSYDAPDGGEWILIRIQERDATEMTPGVVTELVVPANGWY